MVSLMDRQLKEAGLDLKLKVRTVCFGGISLTDLSMLAEVAKRKWRHLYFFQRVQKGLGLAVTPITAELGIRFVEVCFV